MNPLSDMGVIKNLLARHGFTFSKSLGQNFLVNPSVCPRMAELSGAKQGVGVLEIGPGIGVLTTELAARASRVAAIELDRRLLPVLDETLGEFDNVTVIPGDVMKLDLNALLEEQFGSMPVVVCANLPYYITSPVIMRLLEGRLPVQSITVMVQKEAADRLCAPLGTREAGAVTAAVSYFAQAQKLFQVSRGSFLPAPKVDSTVIRLDIRETPPVNAPERELFRVVHAGFGMRRKTLLNALSSGLGLSKDTVAQAISSAGLAPTVRAEELTLQQFAALTNQLYCG